MSSGEHSFRASCMICPEPNCPNRLFSLMIKVANMIPGLLHFFFLEELSLAFMKKYLLVFGHLKPTSPSVFVPCLNQLTFTSD